MATKYTLSVYLEFDSSAVRDSAATKIKTGLTNAKVSDAWSFGRLDKGEVIKPESSQETV